MNLVDNIHHALVYDFGSNCVRFGYAGDVSPILVVPSSAVSIQQDGDDLNQFGIECLQKNMQGIEVSNMVTKEGQIIYSSVLDTFIDWTLQFLDINDPNDNPVLFNQPAALTKATGNKDALHDWRTRVAQTVFDFAQRPALCFQHDAALACYAHGIHTGLVVDYGWSSARAVPVIEGHPLVNQVGLHPLGGLELTNVLFSMLQENRKPLRTVLDLQRNGSSSPSTTQTNFCIRHLLTDIIRSHMSYDDKPPAPNDEDILDYVYFMAGRQPVEVKDEITALSKLIFECDKNVPLSEVPLQNVVADTVRRCAPGLQPVLWQNIVTSGGLSRVRGFTAKLERKVKEAAPGAPIHVKAPLARSASGSSCVWTGGSIVASLPTFDEMCITREEWDEVGDSILYSKCL